VAPVDIDAAADGLRAREAGPWARDKLAIVAAYLERFAIACKKAPQWNYVDAFAGPGMNLLPDGRSIWGSPLIALQTEPAFHRCLLLEKSTVDIAALRQRTARFGAQAVVQRAYANKDLLPMMYAELSQYAPTICFLDPNGPNVDWNTLVGLSRFRVGEHKTELLIFFPSEAVPRVAPYWSVGDPEEAQRFFGNDRWKPIMRARLAGEISPDKARDRYLRLYRDGVKELGYVTVLNREIREKDPFGKLKYILVFATDHNAGERIMDRIFTKLRPRLEQPELPGMERTSREL
jgi:three-Cys-motif partner protein